MTELTDAEHRRSLLPETYKAFTTISVPGKGWIFVELEIRGKKVVDVKIPAEPEMKIEAMTKFKIAIANHWKRENG